MKRTVKSTVVTLDQCKELDEQTLMLVEFVKAHEKLINYEKDRRKKGTGIILEGYGMLIELHVDRFIQESHVEPEQKGKVIQFGW